MPHFNMPYLSVLRETLYIPFLQGQKIGLTYFKIQGTYFKIGLTYFFFAPMWI